MIFFPARVNNYKIIANQELIAIGASNIIGSFAQSYPVTGSFSRWVHSNFCTHTHKKEINDSCNLIEI